jgi:TolA-binding protein
MFSRQKSESSIEALIQQQVEARVEQIQEEMEQRLEQQVQRLREEMTQQLKEQIQQIRKDLLQVKAPHNDHTNTHPVASHASHRTLGPRKGAHPAKRKAAHQSPAQGDDPQLTTIFNASRVVETPFPAGALLFASVLAQPADGEKHSQEQAAEY